MNADTLVADLEARGVHLAEKAGRLSVRPTDRVAAEEFAALRASKPDILRLLRARTLGTEWSRVPLSALDRILEVMVPWSEINILLVPGCRIARDLRARDPKPGRIWCTCEILDLLLSNVPPDDSRKIAEAKLLLKGTLAGVLTEGEHHPGNSEGKS